MRKIFTLLILYIVAGAWNAWGNRNDDTMAGQLLYVTNPTFQGKSANGWNGLDANDVGGVDNYNGKNYYNAKKISTYNGETFDVWQEVSGLPKGIYSLEVQAFYKGSTAGQSQLYVKVGDNEVKVNIMSINDDSRNASLNDDEFSNDANGYIPKSQIGASAYFNENHYTANIVWIEVTDDNATLRVGIKSNGSEMGDWTCFDNFKLTHYSMSETGTFYMRNRQSGKFLAQGGTWGTQAIVSEDAGLDMTVMQNGDRYVFDTKVVNGYNHYLNANGYVDSQVDFLSWTQRDGNYYTLSDYDNKETNFFVLGGEVDGNTTVVFSGTNAYDYAAQWELVSRDQLINELRNSGASYSNPKNATILIPGAGFNNFDERTGRWKGSPTKGGYVRESGSNHCAEMYDKSGGFDVYQEIYGLPDGVYRVDVQAFYRDGSANANGSTVSNALLYASSGGKEVSVAVPSIYSQAGANGQPTTTTGDVPVPAFQTNNGYIPNNISGAATAFANGLYQANSITVTVTGGTLRLGIKSNGYVDNDWTCFDNFQLTYLGTGEQSLTSTFTGSGIYYLQNVATGEYLQGGLAYGTKAVLGNGIEFELQYNTTGTQCHTLSSGIAFNGHDYLCPEASLDHIATDFAIRTVSNGIYTIATTTRGCDNGNNATTTETQGKLLTASPTMCAVDLSKIHYNVWNSPLPDSEVATLSWESKTYQTGVEIQAGGLIYGDGAVNYLRYADISMYQSLKIQATPGTTLRVLLNRTKDEGTVAEGAMTEVRVTIGNDGWGTVDLTQYEYAHLHAIKVASESAASTVTQMTLYHNLHEVTFASNSYENNTYSQWRLVTEDQRIKDLESASESNPKDATFLIKDACFTSGDERQSKWTGTSFQVERSWDTQSDGAAGITNGSSGVDIVQQLSGFPNGIYEITMQGCHKNGNGVQFYANDKSISLASAVSADVTTIATASSATYYTENYKKTLRVTVTDGNLTIGVRSNTPSNTGDNLLVFDNFRLTYLGQAAATITTYYVRNVATGDFVRAGGRYEAQAIADDWGLPLDFINKGNNICAIDSRISNGGENQYLGTNGFMDSAETNFTVTPVGNHNGYQTYTILSSDGNYLTAPRETGGLVEFRNVGQSPDAYSQWELITREQLINELRNSNASDANPKDATFLIESPNFGRHDLRTNTDNWKGVSFEISATSPYGGVESTDWNSPDNYANRCVEQWNTNFDIYQDLVGLPAGVYELTVQAFYRSGNISNAVTKENEGSDLLRSFVYVKQNDQLIGQQPFLSIMDADVTESQPNSGFSTSAGGEYIPNSKSDAAKAFRDGYYTTADGYNKVRFVVTYEGATVRIGVKKNTLYSEDWSAFDNFRLTYLGAPQNGETQTVYAHEIGTTFGTFYLKNATTGTYLTAGGSDGVSAVLGDKMHQRSAYNDENKYNYYTAGSLSGKLKGVRETDFTFTVVRGDEYLVETGIGGGYLTMDNGAKLNGTYQASKSLFVLRKNNNGNYYVIHQSNAEERFLRGNNGNLYWETSGSTTPDENFQWVFQTKEDLLAEFNDASEDNPIDATFLLRGTAFHKEDSRNSAWIGNPVIGGNDANYVASATGRTFDISQKLTGVPNGVYEFTLQGYYIVNSSDAPQTDVRYYVSTDSKSLMVNNYPVGTTTFVNSKNYMATTPYTVWEETFVDGRYIDNSVSEPDKTAVSLSGTVFSVDGKGFCYISTANANNNQVNSNFAVASDMTLLMRNAGLFNFSSGDRQIAIRNLSLGQTVRIKWNEGPRSLDITAINDVLKKDMVVSTDEELVFRVVKNGDATLWMGRETYIKTISVTTELGQNYVSINSLNDASNVFANYEQGTHPVIRFRVEDSTFVAGVFNTNKLDNAALYMDNVRLTYLGQNASNAATPITIPKGIIHKRSRFYDLAAENGHLTFSDYNTVATNNTKMSDKTMVEHDVLKSKRMIQHTPTYYETVYAMANQKLQILLPSSYTNKNQSANKYYQRIYNYATDDLFVENASTTGVFDFNNGSVGNHTDAEIRNAMIEYEGTDAAPAGGWVLGTRWGKQMVSLFNYTTPTTFTDAIQIGIDHSDFTDVGDMYMFGDLTEPTLGQRLVYTIQPASVMVKKLENCTGDTYLEDKSISFPTVWYGGQDGMNSNDKNAVALDMALKNYFTDADTVPVAADFIITLDADDTGISLVTTSFGGNGERFIKFNYPASGEVTNYKDKVAVITVTSNGKNIARFKLHFVSNTELRPWKDIMGQSHLRRSPVYLDEHAVLMDELNFDDRYEGVTYPSTWPVADETAINGVEEWSTVSRNSWFNPYPLDFDQTSFAVYYPSAQWGQYSVMNAMSSYQIHEPFKDVNQLYYDHYGVKGLTSQQHKYPGGGYFMYIDASDFPSSVATLKLEEELCEGTTIHFSGWVSSMDASEKDGEDNGNAPGYLLFSIVGIKANGTKEVVESFCPGPIRADAMEYATGSIGNKVVAESYNNEVWGDASSFIWQQFAFSFVIQSEMAADYQHYALKIDNYCSKTSGGDMMVDDVRLYIQKAVPDIQQNVPICSSGDLANGDGASTMEIYTTFDQLLNAVNMEEASDESSAYNSYVNKSGGSKIIPAGWYCFLDKEVYDAELDKITDHNSTAAYDAAFNAALVTTGGDGGYYQFNFSTHFDSNDGGSNGYTHNSDYVTYMARGETITTEAGEERRIYLNPTDCAVSLKELTYYANSRLSELNNNSDPKVTITDLSAYNEWVSVNPDWNIDISNATIYGSYMGEKVHYVDLEGYDELRIYQTAGDPIRCIFFDTAGEVTKENVGNNLTIYGGSTDAPKVEYGSNGEYYWSVDLNKVKEKVSVVKLIAIKANSSNASATVTAVNVVRKAAKLEANKDYYIVFRAYGGETGTTSEGGVSQFFQLAASSNKCAAMATFSLVSGTELRYDGTISSEQTSYCTGQIATLKMELLSVSNSRSTLKEEDLFYDWWLGDIESFGSIADGKHDSPQGVLFDFRDAYFGTATIYDGQPAKEDFSEEDRQYLVELVNSGKFQLYQSSLNVKVTPQEGKTDMYVTVMPIVAQLEALTGLPYCKGPLEVTIPIKGTAPIVKDGFQGVDYPMDDVPLRIGLNQLRNATDESGYVWDSEKTLSLYIPLRDIKFSNNQYTKFGKKKKTWNDANTLDIAAVYLSETDDPDMVSYGADVDNEGNRELRYVGKVHTFEAGVGREKFKDYVQITFNPEFTNQVKEGYRYTLKTSFEESGSDSEVNGCHGDLLIPLYIVPEYQVWAGGADGDWANDDNWRRADNEELKLAKGDTTRLTNEQNTTQRGFVPMTFTHVLMKSDSIATLQPVIKDGNDMVDFGSSKTHTPDIQYHMMAEVKAPAFSWFPQERSKDIYCEPFYTNTAKEVHFEPRSQMIGSRYLQYQKAWVEYALESGRWYTLSSPLKGVVSGDMYLPRGTKEGGAKQETPYFTNIDYNKSQYTRLAPAVYQQAWDKAEAITYRLERDQLENKCPPMKENQTATANVARAFDWSREYNDVKVPFGIGGFSVKVDMSDVNEYVHTDGEEDVLLRLPKNDKTYRYYLTDDATNGSETVDLTTTQVNEKNLRENAGKLFTDDMTDEGMSVTLTNNSAENPYFLVGNPFMSGLNLDKFFSVNQGQGLEWKYWILTKDSYQTGVKNEEQNWLSNNGEGSGDVAPLQAFIVKKNQNLDGTLTVTFTADMAVSLTGEALQTRGASQPATLRMSVERDGAKSHATVVCHDGAEPTFKASEDAEALFDSHLADVPTLFTMAGNVAVSVNVCRSLHGLPVGIHSNDDATVSLTFDGVEQMGEEVYLYDMESGESTPILSSGTSLLVSGNSMGRYYLVNTPIDGSETDPAPRVSVDGKLVSIVSLAEEILSVEVHDVPGRRVYRETNAGTRTTFPLSSGIYIVSAKTATQQVVQKIQVR